MPLPFSCSTKHAGHREPSVSCDAVERHVAQEPEDETTIGSSQATHAKREAIAQRWRNTKMNLTSVYLPPHSGLVATHSTPPIPTTDGKQATQAEPSMCRQGLVGRCRSRVTQGKVAPASRLTRLESLGTPGTLTQA